MNRRVDPQTLKEIQMVRAGLVYAERRQSFRNFLIDAALACVGVTSAILILFLVYFGEEVWSAINLARNAN